jgi:hypothetical protein
MKKIFLLVLFVNLVCYLPAQTNASVTVLPGENIMFILDDKIHSVVSVLFDGGYYSESRKQYGIETTPGIHKIRALWLKDSRYTKDFVTFDDYYFIADHTYIVAGTLDGNIVKFRIIDLSIDTTILNGTWQQQMYSSGEKGEKMSEKYFFDGPRYTYYNRAGLYKVVKGTIGFDFTDFEPYFVIINENRFIPMTTNRYGLFSFIKQ